nr:DUF839 domain-containing protein [Acidimicrobiia bacterium]
KPDPRVLGPVADERDGKVRLWLPPQLQYRSFHDGDGPPVFLSDGTRLPGRPDGMASFPGPNRNQSWLVRNHEINAPGPAFGPTAPGPADAPYDPMAQGGTTTMLVTHTGEVLESFTSLNGTQMNCSGGKMPWGAWITCEETVNGPDVGADFTRVSNVPLQQRHGYIFEVPASGKSDRQPVRRAGRFAHEAAAYSPTDAAIYLTEDNFGFPSGFYRYTPPVDPMVAGHLADGGVLEMLRVVGTPNAHLEAAQTNGVTYPVDWVRILDPDPSFDYTPGQPAPTTNNAAISYVGDQGRLENAAHFSRLEGATFAQGEVWFTSTQGGGAAETGPQPSTGYGRGRGQIWSYNPTTATLTCRFQSPGATVLDFPDNITSRGADGTIVICEDGGGDNYIRALTAQSTLFDIALNRLHFSAAPPAPAVPNAPRYGEEFAGAAFSPDNRTLFVNIQALLGVTFAIWGRWDRLGL